jgi:hypothetical protein
VVRFVPAGKGAATGEALKRGTLFRSAVDVLRRAQAPMAARVVADALVADRAPQATRKQASFRPLGKIGRRHRR